MAIGDKMDADKLGFSSKHRDDDCAHAIAPMIVRRKRSRRGKHKDPQLTKQMLSVMVHHHSTYSYLDGYALPEAHVRRATELNMTALALTEHGNVSSHVKLEVDAKKQGIKPIFGVEAYTGYTDPERRTQRKNHLTILAETQDGYSNLLALVSDSYKKGFYYEPTVDGPMLDEYKSGLIVLSGCQGSLLHTSAVGGKHISEEDASYKRAKDVARRFDRALGRGNYYIEVQGFPQLEKARQFAPMAERMSRELGIPLVGSLDCHYTVPEEAEIQKILHNVRPGEKRTLEEMEQSWGYDVPLCPPLDDKTFYRKLRGVGLSHEAAVEAINNTAEIAERCNVEIPSLDVVRFPLPKGYTSSIQLWRDWLQAGWSYRGIDKLPKAERKRYRAQLRHEMAIIESKDFVDYLLIVADGVQHAKDIGIPVGPARGSAAASLACFLLRITEVDPMLFPNLVFERFIDVTREDPPDIDLDFDSDRRGEVREYYEAKYKHVYNLGTFAYYKGKMAIKDVARVHRIPQYEVETIKNNLIERSSGDLRASATIVDTAEQFPAVAEVFQRHPELRYAMDLEGNAKQFGVHAAGLVLANAPITNVCAFYFREVPQGSGNWVDVVSIDKYDAEKKGLVKLDFLGLKTMAMIAEAIRQLGMTLPEFYAIPLRDEETIQGFRENDVVGIFQFDGRAVRAVNGALKPDSFKEVCDVTALSRPGPLHNGAANEYIEVKRGTKQPESVHPALEAITAGTNYQIVYQEQILRIVREIGGFPWTKAAYIRKIISKKLGEQEFNRQWQTFWDGARTLHKRTDYPRMTEDVARFIWGMMTTSGSYAFNAAHTTAYGLISYWCMWLKRHHPAVFFAAALQKLADDDKPKMEEFLRDTNKHGRTMSVRPPDPWKSGESWMAVGDKTLRAGFCEIDGIGPKMFAKIKEAREHNALGPDSTWKDFKVVSGIGPKTVEKMQALEDSPDPFNIGRLDRMFETVRANLDEWELPEPTHSSLDVPYEQGQDIEVVWMGVVRTKNLRDIFESNRARGEELDPATVRDPHLNEFVLMQGYDGEEILLLRIDRWKYPRLKDAIWGIKMNEDVVLVRGVKKGWRSAREIYVGDMWVIDPSDDNEEETWQDHNSGSATPTGAAITTSMSSSRRATSSSVRTAKRRSKRSRSAATS